MLDLFLSWGGLASPQSTVASVTDKFAASLVSQVLGGGSVGPTFLEPSAPKGLLAAIQTGPPLGEASDVVVLVHGITANARTWPLVIGRLPDDVATLSVDLRGRADSSGLPGPWGMATHADDLARLLDHLGVVGQVMMVGHSMGAFVTTTFANRYPQRLRGAVLVDGGVKIVDSVDVDPDALLSQVLGPVLDRLSMVYPSRGDYRQFWENHPAFAGQPWSDYLDAYINHDLGGVEPALASRVVLDAVRQDGFEIFLDNGVISAVETMSCPAELLRAERGLLDQPEPLVTRQAADAAAAANSQLRITTIPNTNHYSIVMAAAGADAVAAAIRRQL